MTFGDIIDRENRLTGIAVRRECILEALAEHGEVSQELKDKIGEQNDLEGLKALHKLAVRVASVEEFEEQMEDALKDAVIPA